jgi:hypothetical protein
MKNPRRWTGSTVAQTASSRSRRSRRTIRLMQSRAGKDPASNPISSWLLIQPRTAVCAAALSAASTSTTSTPASRASCAVSSVQASATTMTHSSG